MGQPSSHTAGEEDESRMQRLLNEYTACADVIVGMPEATVYKRNVAVRTSNGAGPPNFVLVTRYILKNEQETSKFKQLVSKRRAMSSRYLPQFLDSYLKVDSGYCQSFYSYHLVFEYADSSLEKEILNRGKNSINGGGGRFNEGEIWYIMHSLTNSLLELRNIGINHGDIQPSTIIIDEAGNVKLLDAMCYDISNNTGLMRMLQGNNHTSPIAPELMDIYIKRIPVMYNQEKADIFSLGISILSLCALQDYRYTYYDFPRYAVLTERILNEIQRLGSSGMYSQSMIQALTGMLQFDPKIRFSLGQLHKFISDHVEV